MKTDIQIAREATLSPIIEVAKRAGFSEYAVESYGRNMGKINLDALDKSVDDKPKGKLILVSAITPTKTGIGKTTVSIGLAQGLNKIGKNAFVALREPSLGPCFGMKGGAAGGGYAQVLPMEKINLHFTGDFHAITSANNMISALLDNYIYQNRNTEKALKQVVWKRVLDVNDRSLRTVVTGLGGINNGIPAETGFDITPASEVMAILCLAKDLRDLRRRIENIVLGYLNDGTPFTVKDLGIAGAITVLLKDAFNPNIVQTIEQTPALIHGGPFANIAHGCNSLVATKTALQYGDYVVTEAGFGADLGGEKFFDIKCRVGELEPALTVLVATVQAIKLHAGVPQTDLKTENVPALQEGFSNLDRHVENLVKFGQSVCVCINRFPTDTDDEIQAVADYCEKKGVSFAINEAFAKGGEGAVALAKEVVRMVEETPSQPLKYVYDLEDSIRTKVEKISHEIYRANMVEFSGRATKMIKRIEELGYAHFPVCIAKTQYSFTDNAKLYGAPSGFDLKVTDVVLNAGAEMIVVLMGDVMRMPGLPKAPSANQIDIVKGQIEGLS